MTKTQVRSTATVVIVAIMLAGCATAEQRAAKAQAEADALNAYRDTLPSCSNEAQCKAMWDATQLWIVQNAGMKVQIATDVIIETFNPRGFRVAYQATKIPHDGGHVIELQASAKLGVCGSGCEKRKAAEMYKYITEIGANYQ